MPSHVCRFDVFIYLFSNRRCLLSTNLRNKVSVLICTVFRQGHGVFTVKTRNYEDENTKLRIRKRENTKTETRNTYNYRVFVIVLSCFRHRTFILSCFRLLRLLNKNAMALIEHRISVLCSVVGIIIICLTLGLSSILSRSIFFLL